MADDLMVMQRQAARRVREMQEHSRRVFEAHQEPSGITPPQPTAPLRLESEQWLLLGLALLLFRAGCRTELLLALLYMAL